MTDDQRDLMKQRRHEAREEAFLKWLSSTKFQVFAVIFIFAACLVVIRWVSPIEALKQIVVIGVAYMGADVAKPIVELIAKKFSPRPPETK